LADCIAGRIDDWRHRFAGWSDASHRLDELINGYVGVEANRIAVEQRVSYVVNND
jgi:hypothetical protein